MVGFKVFLTLGTLGTLGTILTIFMFFVFCFLGFGYYSVAYVFGYVGADG